MGEVGIEAKMSGTIRVGRSRWEEEEGEGAEGGGEWDVEDELDSGIRRS